MMLPLVAVLGLFSGGNEPIDTMRQSAANSAEACKECHLAEYQEWRASRHSMAWTNDFFQFDYKTEQRNWCRNCHAPMLAQQENTAAAALLRTEGVNCITCHVRGETFFAASKRPGSPHDTVASEEFASDRFCAGCHQFSFPVFDARGELAYSTEEPMQNTVEEFRKGPMAADRTCRDCHASTPGSHAYPGAHDIDMLRSALSFQVCRSDQAIRTTLTNIGAGHNVPTGDVHRHILVKAWRSTAPAQLIEAFYGRRFEPLVGGGKRTIWDSSLPPNTYRRWQFDASKLGAHPDEPVNVEVRYLYGSRESYRPPFREAAYQTVFRVRKTLEQLDACSESPTGSRTGR